PLLTLFHFLSCFFSFPDPSFRCSGSSFNLIELLLGDREDIRLLFKSMKPHRPTRNPAALGSFSIQAMTNPCPTVRQLLDGVKSLTRSDGTFQDAWSRSFIDPFHCAEQGGFIYIDFPVPSTITRAFISFAPAGATMNQRTAGPNASIDLNRPGINQNNVILVANFHTHPLSQDVGGDVEPSRADKTNAYARGLPGIVISRGGIYSYGPENRENTANPKGYPPSITPPAIINARRERLPPPPWPVPNQWPEALDELLKRRLGRRLPTPLCWIGLMRALSTEHR
ncbi:hypothetical protein BDP27DRAFT_1079869, partial [Rhodocollybia butyracea]